MGWGDGVNALEDKTWKKGHIKKTRVFRKGEKGNRCGEDVVFERVEMENGEGV